MYHIAVGHDNECHALELNYGGGSGSLFTVSSMGLELQKQFRPNTACGPSVSLAGQLVVSTKSGLQFVHKDGSMAFARLPQNLSYRKKINTLALTTREISLLDVHQFMGKRAQAFPN